MVEPDDGGDPAGVDIEIFGGLGVQRDGVAQPIGGLRQRRLLAILVVDLDRVVPTGRIIEAVWYGDQPPAAADRTLQTYVSRLRTTIGERAVVREHGGYRLRAGSVRVSSDRFAKDVQIAHAARSAGPQEWLVGIDGALAHWRGRPYGDLADEPFLVGEVHRLGELRQAMAEDRVEALALADRRAEALGEAELLLAEAPLRERPYQLVMTQLYRAGRAAEALRCYQRYRALLAAETGLDPGPTLQGLEQAILSGQQIDGGNPSPGRLADFRLGEIIGGGVTATVHRAVHLATGRVVALKAIRPELLRDPDVVARFDLECEILAQIEHPNVVPMYDAWRGHDGAWIATRLLRRGSLAGALDGKPWPLDTVTTLVDQIAGALDAVHSAGALHGDVSPTNILLDDSQRAHLADFGMAARLSTAPAVDTAGDVAGLIQVAASCLCGRPLPIDADPVESVRAARPDLKPEAIEALAVDPTARNSAAALALALRGAARGRPVRRIVDRNPYKALRAFREADAGDFFGRDQLVAETIEAIARHRMVTVIGPSGSGKSSLARAGVVPALRAGALPGSTGWALATMQPGANPIEELEAALLRAALNPPATILEQLTSGPPGLHRAAKRLVPDDGALLIVVDQLEELWTHVSSDDTRNLVLAAIVHACSQPRSPLRLLATLRADFVDQALQHPAFAELFRAGTVLLPPLGASDMYRAVSGPLDSVGLEIEPSLSARLIADASSRPGSLPLLQFVLWQLVEQRTPDTTAITSGAYDELGGLAGAVALRAEALFQDLDEEDQAAARRLFRRLVTPGVEHADTRRRVVVADLPDIPHRLVEQFVSSRLLTADQGAGRATIELAHEALLRSWPRLADWVDEDREQIAHLRHLADAAGAWIENGRDPSDLYRGRRLDTALPWLDDGGSDLAAVEIEYLTASKAVADADRERAAEHEIRSLLVDAKTARTNDPRRAIMLALAAHDRRPSLETLGAVQGAVLNAGPLLGTLPPAKAVAWITDDLLVAQTTDNLVWWDLDTFTEQRSLTIEGLVTTAINADRSVLATGSATGTVRTLDPASGETQRHLTVGAAVTALFLTDAGQLVIGTESGGVLVLDDCAHPREVARLEAAVVAVAISPDGASIAASTGTRGRVVEISTATGEVETRQLTPNQFDWTGSAAVAYDDQSRLITGAWHLEIFDRGSLVISLPGHVLAQEGTIEFRAGRIVTWEASGRVRSLDLRSMTQRTLNADAIEHPQYSRGRVAPDGTRYAHATVSALHIRGLDGHGPINTAVPRHGAMMTRIGHRGVRVATSYHEGFTASGVRLWDLQDRMAAPLAIASHPYLVFRTGYRPVLWEPGGNTSATWTDSPDHLQPLPFSDVFYSDIDFTPDGTLAFQATIEGTVEIYRMTDHALLERRRLPGTPGRSSIGILSLSRNGRRMAVSTIEGWLSIWDLTQPGLPIIAEKPGLGTSVWVPDGTELACVHNHQLTIRDAETLEILRGPTEILSDLIFAGQGEQLAVTADGRWVVASTLSGTQLFDLATLTPVGDPFPHDPATWCSAIDETASMLVTNDGDWAKVWTIDPEHWITAARRIRGRYQ